MPIGTSKVGLFGGVSVEAGSQTFNSPGTFTVVPGLTKVSLSGRGGSGNAGNPGTGASGAGGQGGYGGGGSPASPWGLPSTNFPSSDNNPVNKTYNKPASLGASGGVPAGNPSGGTAGNPGTQTSVFGVNVGNIGTGGSAGTGSSNGNAGVSGNAGVQIGVQNAPSNLVVPGSPAAAGGNNNTHGFGAGQAGGFSGSARTTMTFTPDCCPIQIRQLVVDGGAGGGGGGAGTAGQRSAACGGPGYPANCNQIPLAGGQGVPVSQNFYGKGGAGGKGGHLHRCQPTASHKCTTAGIAGGPGGSPNLCPVNLGYQGAGGGGGGGGGAIMNLQYHKASAGTGGGGGGAGGESLFGNSGNPGNSGGNGNVACVSVNAGCYPVVVGTSGTVTISWNAQ